MTMPAAGAMIAAGQFAKSRPERNTLASGTLAKTTPAMIGPTPGDFHQPAPRDRPGRPW
jgi:hypothetical protein